MRQISYLYPFHFTIWRLLISIVGIFAKEALPSPWLPLCPVLLFLLGSKRREMVWLPLCGGQIKCRKMSRKGSVMRTGHGGTPAGFVMVAHFISDIKCPGFVIKDGLKHGNPPLLSQMATLSKGVGLVPLLQGSLLP
jgi:hypothetical protein